MRCFTFKSLKSLKAPGLDGFDIGLLNLHREKAGAGGGGEGCGEGGREEKRVGALFNPTAAAL